MTEKQGKSPNSTTSDQIAAESMPRKRVTKKLQPIDRLGGKGGADLVTLSKKFGWQTHATRAALSGLREAGYELEPAMAAKGNPTR